MIKATKYNIFMCLALLFLPVLSFAQYIGGNGNVETSSTYTLTSCPNPPQFSPFFGGSGNLSTHDEKAYSICGTPANYFAYMGGNDDGSALLTHTTTTCGTPANFFAYMGGIDDGSSALTYTTTTCGTPSQFFAYMGGNDDGSAVTTFTQCSTNPPVAQFSVSTQTVCVGSSASFTDQSLFTPISWNWVLPGATPSVSTLQNPNVVYNTPGVYSVSLTVTNSFGSNTKVMTNYITVNSLPIADAGNNTTVCSGNATVLNASGGTSYSWTPSTGLSAINISNPVANPSITTIYTVNVSQNGCSKTDVVTVSVTAAPDC
jgi:PKD repeat protein